MRIQVEGLNKAHAVEITDSGNCLIAAADIEEMFINQPDEVTNRAIILGMRELIRQYGAANSRSSKEILSTGLSLMMQESCFLKYARIFLWIIQTDRLFLRWTI